MLYDKKWDGKLFDLSKPSLTALSYMLRNKEQWPTGFMWDYKWCDKCAMGLARTLWEKDFTTDNDSIEKSEIFMINTFGLGIEAIQDIFEGEAPDWMGVSMNAITPEMVADKIDKYISKGDIRKSHKRVPKKGT